MTVGWLCVIGWLAAPALAWQGFWMGVAFFGESPTAAAQHQSHVYLAIAAVLGLGLPVAGYLVGVTISSGGIALLGVTEFVATVGVPIAFLVAVSA